MLTDGAGRSPADVAATTGIHIAEVSRALPLAFLAPEITDRILTGRHAEDLTARHLSRIDLPVDWHEQVDLLGL